MITLPSTLTIVDQQHGYRSCWPTISLSVLDAHFCVKWDAHRTSQQRYAYRKRGGATYRIVRYADDFVIMVAGTKEHAHAL